MDRMKARFGAAALLASATLLWAATAQAKQLSAFSVCGTARCRSITDRNVLRTLIRSFETQSEPARVSTPPPSPFLRLEYWIRGDRARGPSFVQYYIPSRDVAALMTGPGLWTWVRPDAVNAVFRRVSGGVAPFRAPRFSSVTIDGQAVRGPASYVRLFALAGKADRFPDEPDWQRIVIRTADPSPWSTSAATLEYSKSTDVLWRGSDFVKIDASIASRIEAREPLSGPAGRSFPWTLLFGGLGGAAVIVPAAVFFRRRRSH
jgi:hypothetical protein